MSEHSKYSPSSAYRWLKCPPSLEGIEPDDPCEAAELGTTIHAVVAGGDIPAGMMAEDREILDLCVKYWNETLAEAIYLPGELYREQRMVSKILLDGQFGGTADLIRVSDDTIHVYDLKTGMGAVSAEDNPQLGLYLLLAKEFFPGRERFFATIV